MKKTVLITITLIIALAATASGDEIFLKRYFFGGWKYSSDNVDFKTVGWDGSKLKARMAGNEEARAEMDIVRKRKVMARVIGIPGAVCVGWVLGDGAFGKWDSTNEYLLAAGLPLLLAAVIFDTNGNNHMKKAVRIYNGEEQALMLDMDYKTSSLSGNNTLTLALNFTF